MRELALIGFVALSFGIGSYNILEELNREQGLTMVVVSHDPGIAGRAPRRLGMVDGRIVSDRTGPPEEGDVC